MENIIREVDLIYTWQNAKDTQARGIKDIPLEIQEILGEERFNSYIKEVIVFRGMDCELPEVKPRKYVSWYTTRRQALESNPKVLAMTTGRLFNINHYASDVQKEFFKLFGTKGSSNTEMLTKAHNLRTDGDEYIGHMVAGEYEVVRVVEGKAMFDTVVNGMSLAYLKSIFPTNKLDIKDGQLLIEGLKVGIHYQDEGLNVVWKLPYEYLMRRGM